MSQEMPAPLPARARSLPLDVLRGFAVFGIVVANVRVFTWIAPQGVSLAAAWPGALDVAAVLVTRVLFLGKFNALFSFLFGLGFTLQIDRLGSTGALADGVYMRRLGALLVIGLAHLVLLWPGDILVVYALMGLVLLCVRRIPDRVLIGLALGSLVAGALVPMLDATLTSAPLRAIAAARDAGDERIWAHGTFLEVTRLRARFLVDMYAHALAPNGIGRIGFEVLGTALLGCVAGRRQLLVAWEPDRSTLARCLVATLGSGGLVVATWLILRARHLPAMDPFVVPALYDLQRPILMVAYVCAVALALRRPRARSALALLAPVGRMPLTSYLAQSLVMTSLFYGYGAGLYAKLGPAAGIAVACAIYGAQVVASAAWLRRFELGPMEWLWRVATYGRPRSWGARQPTALR